MKRWTSWQGALARGILVWWMASGAVVQTDTVVWRENRLDADVRNRSLTEVLQSLASATGWRVYLEPQTHREVTAKFEQLSVAQALPRLLADLNFALLPQTNGVSRLYVFRTTATGATELIEPVRAAVNPPQQALLAKELIVTLKPGAPETIEQLAQRLGAKVIGRIDELGAYRLEFEDEDSASRARTELENLADVESVDSNYLVQPPPPLQPLPLSQVPPLALRPKITPNSAYTIVALIDTPVALEQPSIKDFLLPGVSLAGSTGDAPNLLTHGTAMAETILRALSTSPGTADGTSVRILPIDIYGNNAATTTFDVGRGIYAAAEAGPTIINLSLGSDMDSPFLHRLIQDAINQGPLVVAAAGNEPVASPVYPAAYPEVLAVTAGDRFGRIAPYANRGDFVDLIAPGTAVVQFENRAFVGTGTSYSTAYISGIAAGLVTGSNKTMAETVATIREQFGTQPTP